MDPGTFLIYGIIACVLLLVFPTKKKPGFVREVEKQSSQARLIQLYGEDHPNEHSKL